MPNQTGAYLKHPDLGMRRGCGAAHARHIKKGIAFRETCRICVPSYVPPPDSPAAKRAATRVGDPIPVSGPAHAEPKKGQPLDFARLWRLIERRRPLSEIAQLFNLTQEQLQEEVRKHFGCDWAALAERAPQELENDLLDTVYKKARQGDVRFVLILERWGLIRGDREAAQAGRIQGIGDNRDIADIPTPELERRAQDYDRQIERLKKGLNRPPTFSGTVLSPTCEIRPATIEEIREFEDIRKGVRPVQDVTIKPPDSSDHHFTRRNEESAHEQIETTTEQPKAPDLPPQPVTALPGGPVVARPEPGMLHLRGGSRG